MRLIQKNLASIASLQKQSKIRGESIDRAIKDLSAEQKRIAQQLGRSRPVTN
jgi:hypothetical protein